MTQSDPWMPTASIQTIKQRAQLLKNLRDFFQQRSILEVETPVLSHYGGTEPNLSAITANFNSLGEAQLGFLQTSPEFAMKRLLAAGIGDCYQITKAFRNEESGRFHNPEFSLLEWYRTGINEIQLLQEIDEMLQKIVAAEAAQYCSYSDLFNQYLTLDVTNSTFENLRQVAINNIQNPPQLEHRDEYLELLFSYCIEPKIGLKRPCFVTAYPASQASLARISTEDPELSCRFEIFYKGIELGNGFYELSDADEQYKRFKTENNRRRNMGLEEVEIDPHFIQALRHGLPESSGVAIGIDRLLMIITSAKHIDEVLSFPIQRA